MRFRIKNNTTRLSTGPATPPSGTVAATGSLTVGAYKYKVTYVTSDKGETVASNASSTITTTNGNQTINLTIPVATDLLNVTGRSIYRTAAGGTVFYFLATVTGNITTTYSDTGGVALNTAIVPPIGDNPKTYYASDQTGANCIPIGPQETISISDTAKDRLMSAYGSIGDLAVLGTTGSEDLTAPTRLTVSVTTGWTMVDFGADYGYIELVAAGALSFSFSGFTSPATDPPANKIGTLAANEATTIWSTIDPERYMMVKAGSPTTLYVTLS